MSQWWSWGSDGDKSSRCSVDSSTQPNNSQQGPWPQHPFCLFLQPPRVHTALCTCALSFLSALQAPYWLLQTPGPHGSRVLKKQAVRLKALNVFTFYLFMLFHIYIGFCLGPAEGIIDYGTGGTGSYELTCGCCESSGIAVNALNHCTISCQSSSNF